MERKILVLLKLKKEGINVSALEGIGSDFQLIFQSNNIPFKYAISDTKQAINDIETIVKGKINSVICCFDNTSDFYTKVIEVQKNFHNQIFTKLHIKAIHNEIAANANNDFLITLKELNIQADDGMQIIEAKNLKNLLDKPVAHILLKLRASFIKNEAFSLVTSLCNSLNLKVEKYLSQAEMNHIFVTNTFYSQKPRISLSIKSNNIELALLEKDNLINLKNLDFGLKNLISSIANQFDISFEYATYLVNNYENFQNQTSVLFRRNLELKDLSKKITNFFATINAEIINFCYQNNLFTNIDVILSKTNLVNDQTLIYFLNDVNGVTINFIKNHWNLTNKSIGLDNNALMNYLAINQDEKDITDTFIIYTNVIENVKIKKSIFAKAKMLLTS
ncbi:hypothetical protein [[Mycoplasma] gypis]|uniref:Uncharacterized protein n=1 Tax=[Mycoplasma] gypis TaxID=92404 RepID=A0ABZ2RR37_9BACT|nr:hypothetical protein [[Mycoplasma] gypis]MBN0919199.1 hypothetical protein [[Mycoplasma] gypis]